MSDRGYVKFTGEYSKLKDMGFTFQKLYASNYMQWCKDHFRVWKRGGDITHDSYDLYKVIEFFRTNPTVRTTDWKDGKTFTFFKFYDADNNYTYHPYTEENKKLYGDVMTAWGNVTDDTPEDELPPHYTTETVDSKFMEFLQEWKDMGWWELAEYPED